MQLTRGKLLAVALGLAPFVPSLAHAEESRAEQLPARDTVAPEPSVQEDTSAPPPPPAPAPARDINVRATSELSSYADTDHVYVVSPTIGGSIASPTAGWSVNARYLVDVVSAASVDIVSTASRRWEEVRHVGSADMEYKPDTFGFRASANVSSEPDYLSLTGGGAIVKDLLDKHLTLLGGYSYGHDIGGRTGTAWSVFNRKLDRHAFKLGATVIVNRTTVASVVLDTILERGDPSKPYRYVPLFAPGTDVPKGASPELVTSLRLSARPLEQLPLSRDRFALSGRIAHRIEPLTLRADERVYADSWAMFASTTDARLLIDVSRRFASTCRRRSISGSAPTCCSRASTTRRSGRAIASWGRSGRRPAAGASDGRSGRASTRSRSFWGSTRT